MKFKKQDQEVVIVASTVGVFKKDMLESVLSELRNDDMTLLQKSIMVYFALFLTVLGKEEVSYPISSLKMIVLNKMTQVTQTLTLDALEGKATCGSLEIRCDNAYIDETLHDFPVLFAKLKIILHPSSSSYKDCILFDGWANSLTPILHHPEWYLDFDHQFSFFAQQKDHHLCR